MSTTETKSGRPLDDVMIAMDVVDTMRHDKRIVERELNETDRRAELIERLREIYQSQGIDVPDRILEEGVKALAEKRFVYTPPAPSLPVRLAQIYVARERWGKPVLGVLIGGAVALGGWYGLVERPRTQQVAAERQELQVDLPGRVARIAEQIEKEATSPATVAEARRITESAKSAAAGGQVQPAREAEGQVARLLGEIRLEYDIRIVNRRGEITGLWRVPKVNPLSRNYYLVVEAIDKAGQPVPRDILNEETGNRETVNRWAVRVEKSLFDQIQADKLDDGIIQNSVLARKKRGEAEPAWRIAVPGGALTRW